MSQPTGEKKGSNIVIGFHPVYEALKSEKPVEKLLLQVNLKNDQVPDLVAMARSRNIPIQRVPTEKLNKITHKNHQGIIAQVSVIYFTDIERLLPSIYEKGKEPFLIVLDQITDIRNFGAICRTAECAGVDAVIIPAKGAASINFDALKTSAGALNHLPVCKSADLKATMAYLKESGLKTYSITEKTDKNVFGNDFEGPVALVLGSEEFGISKDILKLCDASLSIPMFGKIDSLNVSVSAALAMYEVVNQRNKK